MVKIGICLPTGCYLDYLGYLFPRDPESGDYAVSSVTDFGKLLIAYAKVSDKPVRMPEDSRDSRTVTLTLPLTDISQDLQNKFLYYTKGDTVGGQPVPENLHI